MTPSPTVPQAPILFPLAPFAVPLAPPPAPVDYAVSQDDALAITDTIDVSVGRFVAEDDTLGVTDALIFDRGLAVADPLGVADLAALSPGLVRDDALGITDSVQAVKIIPVDIADLLGVTDSQATLATLERTVADTLGLTDSQAFDRGPGISDPLAVADALAQGHGRQLADPVGLTDQATVGEGYVRSVTNALGITDLANAQILLLVQLADPLAVGDVAAVTVDYVRLFDEPLALIDSVGLARALLAADGLVVADMIVLPGAGPSAPSLQPPLTAVRLDGYGRAVRLGATLLVLLSVHGAAERLDRSEAIPLDADTESEPA